ncbi:family 43 glycosylhydrolase [Flavobacterium agrisoli]|uniref:Family 43 glycosylhydrolase n=1 Tax=Flavobacterium agrisoli TaxID=2793066 RepID=A0A934PL37_9FLAO|nr:family 43 glycosylhydrolase [Flavobacterium agrisoli]MBK0369280.1 family 43 glycosylhydrolase [Flavobacterium agrisoli]
MLFKSKKIPLLFCFLFQLGLTAAYSQKEVAKESNIADKPLFRDPIYDGAADPVVIWNKKEKKWFMFYTNRRASDSTASGVSWVHGTKIGVAESTNGTHWTYKGVCNVDYTVPNITHWAPDVIEYKGVYHMYLTIVPGIFEDWYHPRYIIHLTSKNMMDWKFESQLKLASERCIDASVYQLPNGNWRMFYNNENDGKSIYYADSPDLYHWTDAGKKIVSDRGEGPKVFRWKNKNWMITDSWRGLNVYTSADFLNWKKQEKRILDEPGTGVDDQVVGNHPDVLVNEDKAYLFYFTHPGKTPENKGKDTYETRRSTIHLAELELVNGEMICNRNKAVEINLKKPKK